MTAYIVRRVLSMLPVMAIVAIFVFLLLHLAPGDPAAIMAGDNATPENIAQIRQKLAGEGCSDVIELKKIPVTRYRWTGKAVRNANRFGRRSTHSTGSLPALGDRSFRVAVSAIPGTARAKNNSAALPIRDAGHGESW